MDNLKKIIINNGIVLFPTDTVYGLGVLPNDEALKKLYNLKKRDENKKVVALVSSKEKAKFLLEKNVLVEKIIDKFFPGEITIIAKRNKENFKNIDYEYLGVRMPNSKLAIELIDSVGGILMTSSANISGQSAVYKFEDISKEILENVDIVFKEEENLSGRASSIFKIENDEISILRKGNISFEEVKKLKEEH